MGIGAEVGPGMLLGVELGAGVAAGMAAGVAAGADPRKTREIQADPPKSRLLVQNGLPLYKRALNPPWGGILGATFKNRKVCICPRHVL